MTLQYNLDLETALGLSFAMIFDIIFKTAYYVIAFVGSLLVWHAKPIYSFPLNRSMIRFSRKLISAIYSADKTIETIFESATVVPILCWCWLIWTSQLTFALVASSNTLIQLYHSKENGHCVLIDIFFPGLFFTLFSYFWSFMVVWGSWFWGWVMDGFLGGRDFSWWGLGTVEWGLLGLLGLKLSIILED